MSDVYAFTIDAAGIVTEVFEVLENGTLEPEHIDDNESYSLIDGFVVEVETGPEAEWEVYAQDTTSGYWVEVADGDGAFDPAILATLADTPLPDPDDELGDDEEDDDEEDDDEEDDEDEDGGDLDAYVFEFDESGSVTAVFEVEEDGTLDPDSIDADESFTLIDGFVVEIDTEYALPEWTVYAPADTGDLWYEVAEGHGAFDAGILAFLPVSLSADDLASYTSDYDIGYHWGAEGDDSLEGSAGDDHMGAGAGNDSAAGGAGNDLMGGGTGNDTLSGDDGDDVIGCGLGDDSADGGAGADIVNGGAGNDTLSGAEGNDTMGASFGSDSVDGGAGDDSMGGGAGTDDISCGDGNDSAGGGEGNDTVDGGAGDDFLAGGGRDDLLLGGAGDDTLNGGDGNDTMTGGAGADMFVFNHFSDNEVDVITDFEDGVDLLRLSDVEAEGATGAQGMFDALVITDVAGGAQITNDGHTILLEGVAAADLGLDDFIFV